MTGKIFTMKRKANGRPNQNLHGFAGYLLDSNYGLYVDDYFNELLRIERKRTERSKKPFLLVLVDISRLAWGERDYLVHNVCSVLFKSTREIDVKGWYKHDAVVGILFTELAGVGESADLARSNILRKLQRNLSETIGLKNLDRIIITSHVFPEDGENEESGLPDSSLYPDLLSKKSPVTRFSLFLKRLFDLVVSALLLVSLSPLLFAIAFFVKATSEGPVFFRQKRVGHFGKTFTFLKFRSMRADTDSEIHKQYIEQFICQKKSNTADSGSGEGNGVYKITNDPRVTRVGGFLRKTSLDELPQLINVFRGEMSLVGPRPPIPYECERYDIWHRRRLLEIKPGLTGLWQVTGRSSTSFDEMVRLDLKYALEWSLWLDLKILLQTPWVVITGKGAY